MLTSLGLGPVMFDLAGLTLTDVERERLQSPAAGGIIFFARNYQNPEQLYKLVLAIRRERPELLIAVDQEGGRVQRFREGFTRLPPAMAYAKAYPDSLEEAAELAHESGWLMAAELRALEIDFSFAPVLDVESGISQVIGDRSFGYDTQTTTVLAKAFAAGMRDAGMAAVGKHFPGHGAVAADSHLELPVDPRPLAEIEARDLPPFRELINEDIEAIMPAHVVFSACDPNPAGFSPFWIGDVLRQRLGFDGAVFSDDLTMAGAAIAGDYPRRARLALAAGCDMVLVCNAPDGAAAVLDALANQPLKPESENRLARLHGGFAIDWSDLQDDPRCVNARRRLAELTAG